MELTAGTQAVLEKSIEEAQRMGHQYIGTEHILLGIISHGEGIAVDMLKKMGISSEQIRRQIKRVLQETPSLPEKQKPKREPTRQPKRTVKNAIS